MSPTKPGHREFFIIAFVALSWLWMQIVHESGHVLVGLLTGGKIAQVLLHPLELSRTELSFNPRPLAVAWGGPLFGCVAPVVLWSMSKKVAARSLPFIQWFAGFTLIANGVYIGSGTVSPVGDAEEMILNGCPIWPLTIFGLITVASGFMLWNGLGRHFGIGANSTVRSTKATVLVAVALLITVGIELLLHPH